MGNPENPEFQREEQLAKWRRPDGTTFFVPSVDRSWGLIMTLAIVVLAIGVLVSVIRF